MKKKSISVRLDKTLYDKMYYDRNTNTYIITKALQQFYREKEPNKRLNTTYYNQDLTNHLQQQISFQQEQISFLQQQNAYLSLPWYKKIRYQLEKP